MLHSHLQFIYKLQLQFSSILLKGIVYSKLLKGNGANPDVSSLSWLTVIVIDEALVSLFEFLVSCLMYFIFKT